MKAWKLCPVILAVISANAVATEPTGLALGNGIAFLPAVNLDIETNDNIYFQATNQTADTITRLKPSFTMQGDLGKAQVNAYYQAEQGLYGIDDNDSYLDQRLDAGLDFEISSRHQVSVNGSYNDAHDPRGSGTVEGAAAYLIDPDKYKETKTGLNYVYGADSAIGNIDVFANTSQKRYDNNEVVTNDREFDKANYGAILSLTSSQAAEVVLEARKIEISYVQNSAAANSREGHEQRLLAGLRWDITGATTGEVKIGRSSRFFKQESINSDPRLAWEANLTWQPLSYSTVTFSSAQSSNETNGAGNYISNTFTRASWDHEFSTYYSAGINTSLSSDAYVGDNNSRQDEIVSFGIDGTYSPMPWLDVTASYNQSQRDSTNNGFNYTNQVINLGIELAL